MTDSNLSLKEAFLMFCYTPKGSLRTANPEYGIATAALIELVLEKRIDFRANKLFVLSDKPVGDQLNDEILHYLSSMKKPPTFKGFQGKLAMKDMKKKKKVRDTLLKKRVLRTERKRFLFIPYAVYPIDKYRLKEHYQRMMIRVLDGKEPGDEFSLSLIALLEAAQMMRHLFQSRKEYRPYKKKIKEIMNNSDFAKGMSEAIVAMQTAMIATTMITKMP